MKIQRDLEGFAYETGYKILRDRGTALVPICPGNGHFNARTIDELISITTKKFSDVRIFIPDKPTEHTYRAMGYNEVKSQRKARLQGNNLRNNARRSIKNIQGQNGNTVPQILNWTGDIDSRGEYHSELSNMYQLYDTNESFNKTVKSETKRVIENRLTKKMKISSCIKEGVEYVLEELAWLTASPTILEVQKVAYVYHNQWFLDDFIDGKFDQIKLDNLGYVIIN